MSENRPILFVQVSSDGTTRTSERSDTTFCASGYASQGRDAMPKVKNATSERSGAVMDAFGIVSQRRDSVPKDKFLLSKYFDDKNFQYEYPSPYVGIGLDCPDRTSEIYGAGKPHPKTGCRKIISGKQHIDESSDDFDTLKKIFLSSYIQ